MKYLSLNNHNRHAQKGFSLIELMMGISIFAIGLLALAQLQVASMHGNAFSISTTDALAIAQGKAEELRGKTYSTSATDPDLADQMSGENGHGADGLNETEHPDGHESINGSNVFWNVVDNMDNTKTINIIVEYPQMSKQKTVSLQMKKARND